MPVVVAALAAAVDGAQGQAEARALCDCFCVSVHPGDRVGPLVTADTIRIRVGAHEALAVCLRVGGVVHTGVAALGGDVTTDAVLVWRCGGASIGDTGGRGIVASAAVEDLNRECDSRCERWWRRWRG